MAHRFIGLMSGIIAAAFWFSSAQAIPISYTESEAAAGGATANSFNSASSYQSAVTNFSDGSGQIQDQVDFTHYYKLLTGSPGNLIANAFLSVHTENAGINGVGVANLTFTWLNAAFVAIAGLNPVQVTDGSGVPLVGQPLASWNIGLNPSTLYYLLVSGTPTDTGRYDFDLKGIAGGQGETPLPPAIVLFGTALVSLGILGRSRRRRASVAA